MVMMMMMWGPLGHQYINSCLIRFTIVIVFVIKLKMNQIHKFFFTLSILVDLISSSLRDDWLRPADHSPLHSYDHLFVLVAQNNKGKSQKKVSVFDQILETFCYWCSFGFGRYDLMRKTRMRACSKHGQCRISLLSISMDQIPCFGALTVSRLNLDWTWILDRLK